MSETTPVMTETTDELVLVRRDSGGVFPDGTTNTPAIDLYPTWARTAQTAGLYDNPWEPKHAEVDPERLARARHRWQHPTFTLDLSPMKPGRSRRCGCVGWAATVGEMLALLADTEAAAALQGADHDR